MGGLLTACTNQEQNKKEENMTTLNLTQEWDKVFPLSEKVNHCKVTFETQYGLTLAADLYTPKDAKGKMAAIAVSGPFGATKEQSSGLYAMQMAERGFVALAFDPSFTGESSGEPRRTASPDINTEDLFPLKAGQCGCRTYWHHRHLRLGWHRTECCRYRHTHQGYCCLDDVRHDPRQWQRLFRQRGQGRVAPCCP